MMQNDSRADYKAAGGACIDIYADYMYIVALRNMCSIILCAAILSLVPLT